MLSLSFLLLRLPVGGGATEKVEVDLEPLVDGGVDGVIFIADLSRCQTLLTSLVFSCRSILICTADIQQIPASQTAVSTERKHIN